MPYVPACRTSPRTVTEAPMSAQRGSCRIVRMSPSRKGTSVFGSPFIAAARLSSSRSPGSFSLDENRRRINAAQIAVYQQAVARLHHDVVHGIPCEGFAEIDAQNFHRTVGLRAKELRRVQRSVLRDPACQIDRIPQVRLPRSAVLPGLANFPANPNFGCGFKIVAAEDANSVKRLQFWR